MKSLIILILSSVICIQLYAQHENSFTDPRDGQVYRTIQIADQIWMADNLNYYMDSSFCYLKDTSYCEKYGRIYQFNAALKACPDGWHLASDDEWKKLEINMGMKEKVANKENYRSTKPGQGNKLKEGGSSGMDITFGGFLSFAYSFGEAKFNLEFMRINTRGYFWTSTRYEQYKNRGWARYFNESTKINRNVYHEFCGMSVRCIKN